RRSNKFALSAIVDTAGLSTGLACGSAARASRGPAAGPFQYSGVVPANRGAAGEIEPCRGGDPKLPIELLAANLSLGFHQQHVCIRFHRLDSFNEKGLRVGQLMHYREGEHEIDGVVQFIQTY